MGFGIEILFVLTLGLLVLGPKQLHALLGRVAHAKAQFEEASRDFKSQLATVLDATHRERETDSSQELVVQGNESALSWPAFVDAMDLGKRPARNEHEQRTDQVS